MDVKQAKITDQQRFHLTRLAHTASLDPSGGPELTDVRGRPRSVAWLIKRSVYSLYCDCLDAGIKDLADKILQGAPLEQVLEELPAFAGTSFLPSEGQVLIH